MSHRESLLIRTAKSPTLYMVVGLLLAGVILMRWIDVIGSPEAIYEQFGVVAPLISITIHVVIAITPFPSDVIAMTNGAFYGFALGAMLSWIAWVIAGMLEFGLGYRVRLDFQLEASLDRLPKWMRNFPVDHPVYLIGVRQIPWLGGHMTTFVPGAAGVGLRRYLWCSAIAIVPGAIVMPAIGAGLMKL